MEITINQNHVQQIAANLSIKPEQVIATAKLLNDGSTVPFIARYRKEATNSLDETAISTIRTQLILLAEIDKRRQAIIKSLKERELLTDELEQALNKANTLTALEDIYLPFKPKRRTRATIAKEKGLEPLAQAIYEQSQSLDPEQEAKKYIDQEKSVENQEQALVGANDIIAEWISEDSNIRKPMRELFAKKGVIESKVYTKKQTVGVKYKDYFDYSQAIEKIPSHRVLALFRGEKEVVLRLSIRPDHEVALRLLHSLVIKNKSKSAEYVVGAMEDSYQRLLGPSMETEIRKIIKEKADKEAIKVFSENLRDLLMAAPLGQKSVLAIDPGFRTGCKVVCLDPQGKLLENTTIFPTMSDSQRQAAKDCLLALCEKYKIQAIAIGNGTASRETESFVKSIGLPKSIIVVMVNESGASIYSASAAARAEFPDQDVTVRGSVSIGRRLMDPLAELVKIDPKSIGVGQYQHDVDQAKLKYGLDEVVESCVNAVGVEVNTASYQLLTYVSGLGPVLAKQIVIYRNENGAFKSREALKKVPRLGNKAFEQAAGFLRIQHAKEPLDSSAVHPESYHVVRKIADDLKCDIKDIINNPILRQKIKLENYVTDTIGLPTLNDIMQELAKPGRDPRAEFEVVAFDDKINTIDDLRKGMRLPGIVTNVTNFGAFVDIGVHQDGLVHISQLSDKFVKNPMDVVKVQQKVSVTVMDIDKDRGRIALSMRSDLEN